MTKKALITGITGQDGSYLAVVPVVQRLRGAWHHKARVDVSTLSRIDHIYADPHEEDVRLFLHYGDLTEGETLNNLIYNIRPDEVYNLGAQSHVRVSFEVPEYTANVDATGVTRVLETIRRAGNSVKFYQASSSEMFGSAAPPQCESTCFEPRSPYACAKLYAYWLTRNYREGYDMFACNGILFNHESPRRGETFVTRKITRAIAAIAAGKQEHLFLGNLNAKRDWGYAPEYVEAMHLMLQQPQAEDFVIGTGETHSVEEFVELTFEYAGLKAKDHVRIDPKYFRPTEVEVLIADASKAEKKLNWTPKIKFDELAKIMVDADMRAASLEPIGEGDAILRRMFPQRWWTVD